jgi:DNA-binding transcriptional MerR regulator
MKGGMTIGELANEFHLNPKTVRYYEEVGLLPSPRRNESGYRVYSRADSDRLGLVQRAKLLGLSLARIKELVEYAIDGRCSTLEHRLLSLVEATLGEIDQKIRDLTTLRDDLQRYQQDLSSRLVSSGRVEQEPARPAPCRCIGEGTNGFGQ